MSAVPERPPGLLHNFGAPPRASIVWRGFGRGPVGDEVERIEVAARRGTWLHLCISIGQRDERYHRDWNSAVPLWRLVEPEHGLGERAAQRRLLDFIEDHNRLLDWPKCLLSRRTLPASHEQVQLDHVPTTFVALAKCTGSLWLRDRPAHLARLQAPTLVEPSSTPMRGVRWDLCLWFPDGVPANLLAQALTQANARRLPRPRPGPGGTP